MEVREVDLAQRVHQGVREVEFLVADGDVRVGGDALGDADLVRPEQAVHGDHVVDDAQHAEAFAAS